MGEEVVVGEEEGESHRSWRDPALVWERWGRGGEAQ